MLCTRSGRRVARVSWVAALKEGKVFALLICEGCAKSKLDRHQLSNDQLLTEYQEQQSTERNFRFFKDPLFFTSSVFLKFPKRIAALAMVVGLSLSVHSLGQPALRSALASVEQTIPN